MSTKSEILKALEERRGQFVSGAELASVLGVSRTAVWKGISALMRDGVQIQSRSGSGYMLPKSVNTLTSRAEARAGLAEGFILRRTAGYI